MSLESPDRRAPFSFRRGTSSGSRAFSQNPEHHAAGEVHHPSPPTPPFVAPPSPLCPPSPPWPPAPAPPCPLEPAHSSPLSSQPCSHSSMGSAGHSSGGGVVPQGNSGPTRRLTRYTVPSSQYRRAMQSTWHIRTIGEPAAPPDPPAPDSPASAPPDPPAPEFPASSPPEPAATPAPALPPLPAPLTPGCSSLLQPLHAKAQTPIEKTIQAA
jgi:hypothetical protein